jgi:hypothetical protein
VAQNSNTQVILSEARRQPSAVDPQLDKIESAAPNASRDRILDTAGLVASAARRRMTDKYSQRFHYDVAAEFFARFAPGTLRSRPSLKTISPDPPTSSERPAEVLLESSALAVSGLPPTFHRGVNGTSKEAQ